MDQKLLKTAFKSTIPVLTGYLVLGTAFGILLKENGYGVFWAFVTSLLIYAGSMQFLLVGLLTGGASFLTIGLTTLMVNARHLFYGISMLDRYRDTGKKKPYLIFALTDETYSLVCNLPENIPEEKKTAYCFLVTLFDQIYWVGGSVLGSLIGSVLPFSTEGIDFALTALFVTVFLEQWLSTKKHLPAIIGLAGSLICLLIFGADSFLIPDMLLIVAALLLMRKAGGKEAQA